MKKLYSTAIIILTSFLMFTNPVIISVPANVNWKINSTRSLNHVPTDGDTVRSLR